MTLATELLQDSRQANRRWKAATVAGIILLLASNAAWYIRSRK